MRKFFVSIGNVFKRVWNAVKAFFKRAWDLLFVIFFLISLVLFSKKMCENINDDGWYPLR